MEYVHLQLQDLNMIGNMIGSCQNKVEILGGITIGLVFALTCTVGIIIANQRQLKRKLDRIEKMLTQEDKP